MSAYFTGPYAPMLSGYYAIYRITDQLGARNLGRGWRDLEVNPRPMDRQANLQVAIVLLLPYLSCPAHAPPAFRNSLLPTLLFPLSAGS